MIVVASQIIKIALSFANDQDALAQHAQIVLNLNQSMLDFGNDRGLGTVLAVDDVSGFFKQVVRRAFEQTHMHVAVDVVPEYLSMQPGTAEANNILFWVKVPVLSEAITFTQLSVSITVRFLTRTRFFSILSVININEIVTLTGINRLSLN